MRFASCPVLTGREREVLQIDLCNFFGSASIQLVVHSSRSEVEVNSSLICTIITGDGISCKAWGFSDVCRALDLLRNLKVQASLDAIRLVLNDTNLSII